MKLPPYVSVKNKITYRYSRAYSIKIRRRLSQCLVKYDRALYLKVGCSEAEVPIMIQNMIGGWKADKDETSKAKQDYARGGLRNERLLKRTFIYQKKTLNYLIENQNDNVVQLKVNQGTPTG